MRLFKSSPATLNSNLPIKNRLWMAVVLLIAVFLVNHPSQVVAQSGGRDWEKPFVLAKNEGSITLSMIPRMTADVEDNVHVIWGAWIGPDPKRDLTPNSIMYTWWNGQGWSRPVDVLASMETDPSLKIFSISATSFGKLVILWSTTAGLLVSQAEVGQATNAGNWITTRVPVGTGTTSARLAVDNIRNRWYLVYAQQFREISITFSDDEGRNWSPGKSIWSTATANLAVATIDMDVAEDGSANIVWTENSEERNWMGANMWRARVARAEKDSLFLTEIVHGRQTDPTVGWSVMLSSPSKTIHLFWNNGVSSTTGRFHQWSEDNGLTWSAIERVFPNDLSGQTGQAGLAVDSSGMLHLVTSAMGKDGKDLVLRYASWKNGVWSKYSSVWSEYYGEHPSLVVTGGNRLHLVWRDEKNNIIAYSTRLVDAPATPKQRFVIRQVPTVVPPTQVSVAKIVPTPSDVAVSTKPAFSDSQQPPPSSATPMEMLLPSILPVVGLCLLIILIRLRSLRLGS